MIKVLLILALCCVTTILLESIPILFLKNKKAWWKASILGNVVTNPVLNVIVLLLRILLPEDNLVTGVIIVLEIAVVFFEAWFYRLQLSNPYKDCILFSLLANGLSFVLGSALNIWILKGF